MHFFSKDEGLVGGLKMGSQNEKEYVLYSTNNGEESWKQIFEWESVRNGLRGLYFLNKYIGFAASANGKVLKTIDGGNIWNEQILSSNRLRSVLFINENEGFIVGDGTDEDNKLYRTSNGGYSWESIPTKYPDLHRIKRSRNFLWIAGKEGTILKQKIDIKNH